MPAAPAGALLRAAAGGHGALKAAGHGISAVQLMLARPAAPAAQDYLDSVQGRSKEKRYTFDVALGPQVRRRDRLMGWCLMPDGLAPDP